MLIRLLIVLAAFLAAFVYGATAHAQQSAYFRHVGPGGGFVPPMVTHPDPGSNPGNPGGPTEPEPTDPEEPTEPETPTHPATATINAPGGWTFLVSNWSRLPPFRYAFINSQGPSVVVSIVWDTSACGRAGYGWTDSGNIHMEPGTCGTGQAMMALESELGLAMPAVTVMQPGDRPSRPTFFDGDGNTLANPPPM